ncbi:MAG TPA: hypothetical protein V6D05_08545 [Stenomitos sp.]
MPRRAGYDADLAEGSLEIAELSYQSVASYHAGWAHLHPDDQAEYLEAFVHLEAHLDQLLSWRQSGRLDPDHLRRLAHVLDLKGGADPLLAELRRPAALPVADVASIKHPMVLED